MTAEAPASERQRGDEDGTCQQLAEREGTGKSEQSSETPSEGTSRRADEAVFGAEGDYALARVPAEARYSLPSILLENWSMCGCIASVLFGVTLGTRMTLLNAAIACGLGVSILGVLTFATGCLGCAEGLSTSMLCRWCGFGSSGSAIVSLVIAISLTGWFGIQSEIAGKGLDTLLGGLPVYGWTLISGAVVTIVSVSGFQWMVRTAWVMGPAFFITVVWAVASSLSQHSLAELAAKQPSGEPLSLLQGTGIVVGGWIVGAVISPDLFRFSHSSRDVGAAMLLSRIPAILTYNLAGVVIAKAYDSSDFISVMRASVGWGAVVVVVAGEFAINAMNLYQTGLAMVAFFETTLGLQIPRRIVTLVCGVVGSSLGAAGILSHLERYLGLLSVTFPPIAGIMLCEYHFVQHFIKELQSSKQPGSLPTESPNWVPATLAVWAASVLFGFLVDAFIPSLETFAVAAVLYALAASVGALQGVPPVDQADRAMV